MSLKVKEVIKCNKCNKLSKLDTITVRNNKAIVANYLCECKNSTNKLIDFIDIITKKELERKTIYTLLKALTNVDKNKIVITDLHNKCYIENSFGSDRGIYTAMYISTTDNKNNALTVEDLIKLLNRALYEGVMHGYKGGTIDIYENTYLTLGEFGKSGAFIIDIQETDNYLAIFTEKNI